MGGGFCKKPKPDMPCYMMYAFLFSDDSRTLFLMNKFYFCLGVGAEGLGVNAPKPRLLIIFQNGFCLK